MANIFMPDVVVYYYHKALQRHDMFLCKIEELAARVVYAYVRAIASKHEHHDRASKNQDHMTFYKLIIGDVICLVVFAYLFYVYFKFAIACCRRIYHNVIENMTWGDIEALVESPGVTLIALACILQPCIWSYQFCMWILRTSDAAFKNLDCERRTGL
ncbi:hypothetical protein BKA65DRAFT_550124 [Rhexocercosporidium sp. MPI-PUGE-AT-0058]|nr:hypothetical protein BKA65DRAFT_550124 [Rhexocercosporidium sp. MPI-PUGE-AT-0058]